MTVNANMDVKALFEEAKAVSVAAGQFQFESEFERTHQFVEQASASQRSLMATIFESFEKTVLSAAAGGYTDATILEFKGGDTFEDLSILFLLLGGHDMERRQDLEIHGFVPFLKTLKDAVAPFALVHEWDRETNANRLVVKW